MDEETLKKRYGLINLVSHFVVCFKYRQELPIQTLIHKFKYQGNRKAGQLLMDLYLKHIDIYQKFKDIDIIIPMPSHHRKKAKRGFNQCEIMARCIGEVLGKPVMTKAIVKEKNTPSQTTPGINRIENVKGVFAVCDANIIKDRYVLVIDDVITTSSTLKNCVKTVYKANPSKISVMVLAQVA
jgi:ComF family protein